MDKKQTVGQATASMVLGILSLIMFGLLTAVPAVICGHIARGKIKKNPAELTGEGSALAGLIMGYVSIGLHVLLVPFILAAVAIPLMSGNMDRAMATEGQAGLSTVGMAAQIHWAENGSFDGIESIGDFKSIESGDLDGFGFQEEDYVLVSLIDGENYVMSATGGNEENETTVVMRVIDGGIHWEIDRSD